MTRANPTLPKLAAVLCLCSAGAEGGEFLVNQFTSGQQQVAGVAAVANRGFVVVWSSQGQDGSGLGTYARWFDRHGVPLGDDVLVNGTTESDQTAQGAVADPQGRAVVVWLSASQDGDGQGVFARYFDAAGTPLGDEFQVNTYASGDRRNASAAMASTGELVVAWSGPLTAGGVCISARRFASDGAPLGDEVVVESPISALDHWRTAVATTLGFAFVVAWDSGEQVFARRYDADGAAQGASFLVSSPPVPPDPYLDTLGGAEADGSGAFEITWLREDSLETSIHYANRYAANGTAQWSVTTASWGSVGDQGMSVSRDGGLVVLWPNALWTALVGRHFRTDGTPLTDEVILDSCSFDDMLFNPRADHLGTGAEEWVMVWTESVSGEWDVHGQLNPGWVFSDDFESGGTGGWSIVSPDR